MAIDSEVVAIAEFRAAREPIRLSLVELVDQLAARLVGRASLAARAGADVDDVA